MTYIKKEGAAAILKLRLGRWDFENAFTSPNNTLLAATQSPRTQFNDLKMVV